ncbi:MAG: ABC transporter ATP-binding protein [Verrucomicrobia bacterium]|nr:ABC transporter ATP-binding protein [Verrucomicrobiota bacterium]
MEPAIRIEGLSKDFSDGWGRKGHMALEALSLDISKGELVGVFGGNGSGKSTLLKLLCGLLQPTRGSLEIAGNSPAKSIREDLIGYLPERPGFPTYQSPRKLLTLFAKLSGLSGSILDDRVNACLNRCRLESQADVPVVKLSKGGIQRLAMAQALIHDPQVLLLDEPMDGLDPLALEGVEKLVQDLRDEGKTVLISSHLVRGMETLCDRVLILHNGRSIFFGPPDFEEGMESWILKRLRDEEAVHG